MTQISEEIAKEQLQKMLDYYELEVEELDEDIQSLITSSCRQVKKAIMAGLMDIEVSGNNCKVKQYLRFPLNGIPNPITYHELNGKCKAEIKDDLGDYQKIYTLLGVLSREGMSVIQLLQGKDLSRAEALASIFLQV